MCTECTNLHLKRNTVGVILKQFCILTTTNRDRQRQTHTHVYTSTMEDWSLPRTQATLTLYGKLRGSLQRLSQLLRSAQYTQSTTVNIYSPPEEMLPAAKTNHFTAPAAWLIRHLSFI